LQQLQRLLGLGDEEMLNSPSILPEVAHPQPSLSAALEGVRTLAIALHGYALRLLCGLATTG
jgi:hypothetical protein